MSQVEDAIDTLISAIKVSDEYGISEGKADDFEISDFERESR